MIYFNFLTENIKKNKFVSNIWVNKYLILMIILALFLAFGSYEFISSKEFQAGITGLADTKSPYTFEPIPYAGATECGIHRSSVSFRIRGDDGITNRSNQYDINIYVDGELVAQNETHILVAPGSLIEYNMAPHNPLYTSHSGQLSIGCRPENVIYIEPELSDVVFQTLSIDTNMQTSGDINIYVYYGNDNTEDMEMIIDYNASEIRSMGGGGNWNIE